MMRRLFWASFLLLSVKGITAFTVPPLKGNIREIFSAAQSRVFSQSNIEAIDSSSLSDAALWHRNRRNRMMEKYGDRIRPLEQSSSQRLAIPLLLVANFSLLGLSILSTNLPVPAIILLAIFPGSMFSLWQLQILHDALHGSLLNKGQTTFFGGSVSRKSLQDSILFWGSMPSVFGYYLYLKMGHLTHHRSVGDSEKASLAQLFESSRPDFEDGDVLFVAHRMKLKGEIGPRFDLPFGKELRMSISKTGFNAWREGNAIWNSCLFVTSFLYERFMLVINDALVSVTGWNLFFPNKPESFHQDCTRYARAATALRATLLLLAGWKSLLFLFLAETLWSIPPHPACAMFVSNHPSEQDNKNDYCVPTMSTYAGSWYSTFTLGTNYHCEHHDFPTIPLNKLGELRRIAPEFYRKGTSDSLLGIMKKSFSSPGFYACMDASLQPDEAIR